MITPEHQFIWQNASTSLASWGFVCGYCGHKVASNTGLDGLVRTGGGGHTNLGALRICPQCTGPTFLYADQQVPGVPYANSVRHLPQDIEKLYEEARSAIGSGAPTAAVLACRTLLMHVAVEKGAKEGENFLSYVTYLAEKNFIPAGASAWVDKIRTKGNEANHQIVIKTREEAEEMIEFSEMLLKVVYEYPARA